MAANVQLILARDVPNLGRVGDLVSVKAGYARNYLVPQGLGLPASPKRVAHFEHQKKLVDHKRRLLRGESEKRAQELSKVQLTLTARVGEQGKLFGSITSRDIAKALAAEGHVLDHRDIKMDGPIKSVGLHKLDLRLEADVTAQVKLVVAPEEVPEEPTEEEAMEAEAEGEDVDVDAEEAAIQAAPEATEAAEATETAEA